MNELKFNKKVAPSPQREGVGDGGVGGEGDRNAVIGCLHPHPEIIFGVAAERQLCGTPSHLQARARTGGAESRLFDSSPPRWIQCDS